MIQLQHVYGYEINVLTYLIFFKALDHLRLVSFERLEDDLELPVITVVGINHNGLLVHEAQSSSSDNQRFVECFECALIFIVAISVLNLDLDLLHHTGGGSL
jgi:hypothetical protein